MAIILGRYGANLNIAPAKEKQEEEQTRGAIEPERVLNPIVSESYLEKYVDEHSGGSSGSTNLRVLVNGSSIDKTYNEIKAVFDAGGIIYIYDSEQGYIQYLCNISSSESSYEATFFDKYGINQYYSSDPDGVMSLGD